MTDLGWVCIVGGLALAALGEGVALWNNWSEKGLVVEPGHVLASVSNGISFMTGGALVYLVVNGGTGGQGAGSGGAAVPVEDMGVGLTLGGVVLVAHTVSYFLNRMRPEAAGEE